MKLLTLSIMAAIFVAGSVYHMSKPVQDIPTPVADMWTHWKMKYGRTYGTNTEEQKREAIFKDNWDIVMAHNAAKKSWTMGLTVFADMTAEEVGKQYTGFLNLFQQKLASRPVKSHVFTEWSTKNWNDEGAVSAVKNQGSCGSCWAFSTTGAVEGAHKLAGNDLALFSEQQLVDCDTEQDNGCGGGLMNNAFEYIKAGNALMTEDDYPYRGQQGTCKYDKSSGVGAISSYDIIEADSESLRTALDKGPVSVAIEADSSEFQMYTSGVLTSEECGTHLNHGVLAVGYGTEDGENYFLVKNSWGPTWGDNGYIKIGADNICGILQVTSRPVV